MDAYNFYEQVLLSRASKIKKTTVSKVGSNCASYVVPQLIYDDVKKIYPDFVDNLEQLGEISNPLAAEYGLMPFVFHETMRDMYTPEVLQHKMQIAITTVWIAHYIKTNKASKSKQNQSKGRLLDFQVCLLTYFYNLWTGNGWRSISQFAKKQTVKRYGLYNWFFCDAEDIEQQRIVILLDIMHKCDLQYLGFNE